MKKYIKPAIEEINLGVYSPIADSNTIGIYGGTGDDGGYIDPENGGDDGTGMWAPSKKGSNDEDFGW